MKAAALSAIVCCLFGASASGEVIVSHYGAADPETEGWDYRQWGADITVGPVIDDDGYDAWSLYDYDPALNTYGFYAARVWIWDVLRAFEMGWKLTARVRVVDIPDRTVRSMHVGVLTSRGIWQVFLGDDDGATLVSTRIDWVYKTFRLEGSGYRLIEIVYHPNGHPPVARLFVDGTLILEDWNPDGEQIGMPSEIRFGSHHRTDVGGGHYNLVEWEILPEPTAVSVLAAGAIGLLRRRRL